MGAHVTFVNKTTKYDGETLLGVMSVMGKHLFLITMILSYRYDL